MRQPEPFYWAARRGWYVQIEKRQIKLGGDPDPRPKGRPRAPEGVMREYYRVMATNGRSTAEDREQATVAEVCEVFLSRKDGLRENTKRLYAYYLSRFASALAGVRFNAVRMEDVTRAAESQSKWSAGTKHCFVLTVTTAFRWARDAGYLDMNPFAGWANPYPPAPRRRSMTDAEFAAVIDQARDLQWKQFMMFLRGTGCRIGELMALEAKHVDPERPFARLPADLHKTGRKSGKDRVLVLPADVEVMVRALARQYPKGPIFRNSRNGGPWTANTIGRRMRRYREKLGLGDVCCHMIRHATLSRMLDGDTPLHLVAKIAGHSDPQTLMNTYYHPDEDLMVAAADRAHQRKKG